MADLNKRIVVRVSDQQLEWITAWAADEGVDNATFVRMVLDRLSKSRPPLIGMIVAGQPRQVEISDPRSFDPKPGGEVSDQTQAALGYGRDIEAAPAEVAADADYGPTQAPVEERSVAAIPLRGGRVERERYNPGRR